MSGPVTRTTTRRQADRTARVIRVVLTVGAVGLFPTLAPLVTPFLQFLGDYDGRQISGCSERSPAPEKPPR